MKSPYIVITFVTSAALTCKTLNVLLQGNTQKCFLFIIHYVLPHILLSLLKFKIFEQVIK